MPGRNSLDRPVALLQNGRDSGWSLYGEPLERLEARTLEEVVPLIERVERAADEGLVACGLLSYEAAAAFDPVLTTHPAGDLPLAWFSIHDPEQTRQLESLPLSEHPSGLPPDGLDESLLAQRWQPTVSREEHAEAIARIREWIAAGETYQLNYTFRLRRDFAHDPEAYFLYLARRHDAGHAAWLDTGRHAICCMSPELFFRLDGDRLTARPMKGTAPRGRTTAEDEAAAEALRISPKDRAENVMIVDMVRNDLSRIARRESVEVPSLWEIERYPTLFQMTSTCTATSDAPLLAILRALYPCASITGAPKVRTMQLIREIEIAPRGIYTGAIGTIGPGRRARFNVAIRTVHVDRETGRAEYGTGGGIVWDSRADSEHAECLTKALVVTAPTPTFELLETLRWEADRGFARLDGHLARLEDSARYFGFACDRESLVVELERATEGAQEAGRAPAAAGAQRVRLLLSRDGSVRVERAALSPFAEPRRVVLAADPIDSNNRFLFHKTTERTAYERAMASATSSRVPEADDVILWNERGEITESTRANVVVERDGELLTPPVTCGALPGVLRADLLARGEVREAVLRLEDLETADGLWLVSSLRGRLRAELVP